MIERTPLPAWSSAWQAFWSARQPREQRLLTVGALVIGVALLWQMAVAPALQTWREAPAKQAAKIAEESKRIADEQAKIVGGNTARVYGFDVAKAGRP